MPMAFKNAGLTFGVVATFTIGFICTYCVHILVSIMLSSPGLKKLARAKVTVGKRDR
jgi:amino acid permease